MRIAILGGSFDPPHNGHAIVAQEIVSKLPIDAVWIMPLFSHPFGKQLSSPHHRLTMTRLLETNHITVSDIEIKRDGVSYTIDTFIAISRDFPNDQFFWVLGSDQLDSFYKWKKWQEISKNYGLIVVKRGNQPNLEEKTKHTLQLQTIPENILLFDSPNLINISSTQIRENIKKGISIHGLVPDKVEEYIIKNKLYKRLENSV